MKPDSKKLAGTAIISAISFVLLLLACAAPTGRIALAAAAGVVPALAVIRNGISGGVYCYVVTGLLALFLLPLKGIALMYVVFFGHWPVLKSLIERIKRMAVEWLVKLIAFNALLTVFLLLYKLLLTETFDSFFPLWLLYPVGSAAFVLYDLGFSGLIKIYVNRFEKMR
jgi:hypothetical protein